MHMFSKKPPKEDKEVDWMEVVKEEEGDEYTPEMDIDAAINDIMYYADELSVDQVNTLLEILNEVKADKEAS